MQRLTVLSKVSCAQLVPMSGFSSCSDASGTPVTWKGADGHMTVGRRSMHRMGYIQPLRVGLGRAEGLGTWVLGRATTLRRMHHIFIMSGSEICSGYMLQTRAHPNPDVGSLTLMSVPQMSDGLTV